MQTKSQHLDISHMRSELGEICNTLLFAHALSGCDTTSRPYGIGKASVLSKIESLHDYAKVFRERNKQPDEIGVAGHQAIVVMYGCPPDSILDFERASRFMQKVTKSSSYTPPERLLPTSDAAYYHSMRVYHQIQEWLGNRLDATKWGWHTKKTTTGTVYKPKRMDKEAAPSSLLKLVRCNCNGQCNRNTCSYRKIGLPCTMASGQCK